MIFITILNIIRQTLHDRYSRRPKKGGTLPKHNYTVPFNPLHLQLDKNDNTIPGQETYNAVDEISMHHDICYRDQADKEVELRCDARKAQKIIGVKKREDGAYNGLTDLLISYKNLFNKSVRNEWCLLKQLMTYG